MTWRSRFVAVPTWQLKQDDQVAPSAKANPEQMRAYMAHLPAVYEQLSAGAKAEDFQQMRASANPQTRAVGDAYHHLLSPSGADHRLEAEVVEGKGLVVTRGRHRIEAAREIGVPYVPVHVRAADERTLEATAREFEAVLADSSPELVRAHRELNDEHQGARAARERSATQAWNSEPTDRAARAIRTPDEGERSPLAGPTRGRTRQ